MFLLRCLFWLGLVFSQIAQLEGTGAAPFFGQAGALGQQAGGWGQMAAQAAERQCRANPAQCLAQASSVAKAALALNSPKSDGPLGHDSLTSADRAPAWRETRPPERKF